MLARRPSLAAAAAVTCAAVALWVSFGTTTFLDVDAGAGHIGLLPPAGWLAAFLVIAIAVVLLARPPARALLPLWLSSALLLPWLPLGLPLSVFLWTGTIKVWLWTAIAAAVLAPAIWQRLRTSRAPHWPARKAALAAGVLSALIYGFGAWVLAGQHPGGDEPHYLVITQSLLEDHDLRIENNHQQRDYSQYYAGPLKPDFLRRGVDGAIYSIHAPGLPLFVAPVFALFGYAGVVVFLLMASAVGGALAWLAAWHATHDHAASWFGWASVALSAPFYLHASAVYPDGLGAIVVLAASLALLDARARTPRVLVAIGAALAFLPWLHTRFAVLAAASAIVITGRILTDPEDRLKRLVALTGFPIVSAIAWLSYFRIIYGVLDPAAPYGGATNTAVANIVRGIPGLLVDEQFGLVTNAPVYLCSLLGLGAMFWHGSRRLAAELLAICIPYFLVVAFFYMWWGGFSAPARFLVPLTLLLAIPTAVWFATRQSTGARVAGVAALYVSLAVTASMSLADGGTLAINVRDGVSRLLAWVSPVVNLTTALPSLFQNPPAIVLWHAALWLMAIVVTVGTTIAVDRWLAGHDARTRLPAALLVFGLVAEVASMAAVSLVWRSNHATVPKPDAGAWTVLHQLDPDSQQIALGYQPFRRLRPADLPHEMLLTTSVPGRDGESSTMLHLPPGTYEVRGRRSGPGEGLVRVVMDSESSPIAQWTVASLPQAWTTQFSIPVGVAAIRIDVDEAARRTIRDISVRAVSVLAGKDRLPDNPEAERVAHYGPAFVFLVGGTAWVEPAGTWIAGSEDARFAVFRDRAAPIQLFVRNGAMENQARVESGTWHVDLTLRPGEERLIDVPFAPDRATIPLRVQSAQGFRPAKVDPQSTDERFLGVWIETR